MPKTATKYAIFAYKPASLSDAHFYAHPRKIEVVKRVTMTAEQYENLTGDFLADRVWLRGINTNIGRDVVGVIEIRSTGKKTLYIDPEGSSFVRAVGIAW